DVAAAADEADRPRRTPPTRRPPASLLADGEARRVPGSGSCTPRVPEPTAASPILPPRPTPEHRRTGFRSNTPARRTARTLSPASAKPAAPSRRPPGALPRRFLFGLTRCLLAVASLDTLLQRIQQRQNCPRRRCRLRGLSCQLCFDQTL